MRVANKMLLHKYTQIVIVFEKRVTIEYRWIHYPRKLTGDVSFIYKSLFDFIFWNPTSSLFVFFSTHLVGSNHKYLDWFCSLYRIVFWLLSLVQHMKLDIVDDVCFDEDDLIGILVNFLFVFYCVSVLYHLF